MVYSEENTPPDTVIARSEATKQSRGFTPETGLPRRSDDLLAMTDPWESRYTPMLKMADELGKNQLLENKLGRQRQWTDEKRAKQAERMTQQRSWQNSTGPKTKAGKTISSKNNYKHGFCSGDYSEILRLLRLQAAFVREMTAETHEKIGLFHQNHAKKTPMNLTLHQKAADIQAFFAAQGREDISAREVKAIIKVVTGFGEEVFITAPETPLSAEQIGLIDAIVARRANGEPLYRILGIREFWGLDFKVTPDVLDPRPDTETLVEAALAYLKMPQAGRPATANKENSPDASCPRDGAHGDKQIRILDLGTGTGCIAIALLSELPYATAVAVDISSAALAVARENAVKNGVIDRLELIESDLFDALAGQQFDLIVSNPPYIRESDIQNLSAEVKNHDPILALSGGKDGLKFYKKIIFGLKKHLFSGGRAFLEIGFDQLESVTRLVDDSNLMLCDSHADISGIPRVVQISRGDK